jgi:PAS domain S-box-containing protein
MEDLFTRIHPEDRQPIAEQIARTCDPEGSGMAELEFRIIWPDGQVRWLRGSGHAIFEEHERQRRAVRGVGVTLDITEQKRVELALREAEERFRAFMDNTPTIAWAKDPEGRYVYVNRAYEQRLGIRLEDCRGKTDDEIWPPEIARAFQENDREALVTGGTRVMEENINRNGEPCYWWVLKFPFEDAAGNRYIGGVGADITDRKRAEETLRESEEKFRTLTENAQAVIGIVRGRHFVYANPYLSQISGYTREEILEMDIAQLIHADFQALVLDRAARRQRGEPVPMHYEFVMVTKDGQERWLDLSPDAIVYNGQPAVIGIAYDITDRKRAEQQLKEFMEHLEHLVAQRTAVAEHRTEQLRALTVELAQAEQRERRRLAQVLHDHLQQLLVGMKFTTSTIRRRGAADLAGQLHKLDALVEDALKTSRDLVVDLSPPILHKGTMSQVLFWLAEWVHDKHGLRVTVDADERANPQSEEIRTLLFQAVRELLLNTVKHAGTKSAMVQLRNLDEKQVQVIVRDEGAGFDPQARKEQPTGGFGLLSLRERLEALGGHLEIDSSPGQGTQTTVTVPAGLLQAKPVASEADQAAPLEGRGEAAETAALYPRGIRVLLADDHQMVRNGLAELLERNADIEVVGQAANGQAAVEMARRIRPDVVLMDVDMPELDGVEATRRIVKEQPDIRVIGLSVFTEPAKSEAMRSAGAVGYVPKSSSLDALIAAVRQSARV